MKDDLAPTGQRWAALMSGKFGAIMPFEVTSEMMTFAKESKRREIDAWDLEQEA
ncbi:hypothetical protein [Providencia rustigianii]|uniref:hypothetical protein n=1 Tax=Providencia rustigianii TaxID=158850 RepID=UPI0038B270B9